MNRKSQITIFIIVGIVILLGIGLYLGINQEIIREKLTPGVEFAVEEVPIEFRPVSSLVENCLTQIAEEGVIKIGERAGFINLVENNIVTKTDTTSSDAVQFSPDSEYSIPYWWYLSSDNKCSGNCEFSIIPNSRLYLKKNPQEPSIESQLEAYIDNNLRDCLSDFQAVKQQGFTIEEKGALKTTVTTTENDIIVYLDYPIEAEKEGKQEISKFLVRLPLNIRRIYEIALLLTNWEGEYHFLERDVLNLLVGFSAVDKDRLPPMSESKFRIGKMVTWKKSEVKENLKGMLASYIQLIQVYGTRNYEPFAFPGNSLLDSLYNRGMLVPGTQDYSDLEIRFDYKPWWDIYFNMNCNGEICQPESIATDLFALIGIQNYDFVYDISFPVEVEIYDPYAFNEKGYRFKFFLEGNIRNNDVMKADFTPIKGVFIETTMLCDENKRTSGNITLNVNDFMTNEGLDDVQIAYSSSEENCLIGSTENGVFKGQFPVMLGGVITFLKEDYITYSQRFDAKLEKDDRLDIMLKPKLTKKFTLKKRLMDIQTGRLGGEAELMPEEDAYITLAKKLDIQEGEFTSSALYSGKQAEKGEIQIAPGTYDITIGLTYNGTIKIPQTTMESGDEKVRIPGFTLEEGYPVGGISFNFTFTKELLTHDEITFYVLNPDILAVPESERKVGDLDYISNVNELSQQYKGSLVPR